jgi:serine/threonine-protein kinase
MPGIIVGETEEHEEHMEENRQNLVGQTLGTCTLERLIGQGGMGSVYLARQARPQRNVAVKVLLPNLSLDSQSNQDFLARFRREADVIARLEHVNIMPIYEYGEKDGMAYLVMPYLTGGSLREVLSKQGRISLSTAATYIDQAASALDYAHAHGVIHRDLKPANFLLHADGRLVLADFGIARIMDEKSQGSTLTGTGTLLGTPEYMAPEMVRGEQIDYRADIYELGVVLFQMLSGRVPFTGNTPFSIVYKHAQEPVPLLSSTDPSIPPAVDAVIQKATAKNREERYPTVKAMAQDFRAAIAGQPLLYADGQQNQTATVVEPAGPLVLPPPPTPQYNTAQDPRGAYPATYSTRSTQAASPPSPPPNTYAPPAYQPQYQPPYQPPQPARRGGAQTWTIVLAVVFVLIVLGGILYAATHPSTGGTASNPIASPTATTAPGTTPQPTTPSKPTVAPTQAPPPTIAPTQPQQPTPPPSGGIPIGTQLYSAAAPGPNCDNGGGQWSSYNNPQIKCQSNATQLVSTAQQDTLQGIFLTKIPGRNYAASADYVVQAQLQPNDNSTSAFGIYFRNQPNNQLGAYAFVIRPNGSWSVNVYDNNSGALTRLATGSLGSPVQGSVQMAIVAKGSQFSFYINGQSVKTLNDQTYSSGTAGIAVGTGANVTVSNFAVYRVAS